MMKIRMRKYNHLISVLMMLIIALSCNSAWSQPKLDLLSRQAIKMHSAELSTQNIKYYPVIIKTANDSSLTQLDSLGVKIMHQRDELLLAFIPADKLDAVNELNSISRMSMRQMSMPVMDHARSMSNVDALNNGVNLPEAYDGEGVVVGITDIGFDPNHINFLDAHARPSRIKRLVNYIDTLGRIDRLSDVENISQWDTDRANNFHATHVAGILSGSYSAQGYQGVAPAADLVVATSDLYDATILAGVEEIVDYAKSINSPAVVNMSIGSYSGPHDGSDLFCQYLDKIGEDAIVCISAGNTGHRQNVISTSFSDTKKQEGTFIFDYKSWAGLQLYGHVDMWSADSREFQVQLCIYDNVDSVFLYNSPSIGASGLQSWSISSHDSGYETDEYNDIFTRCFSGAVFVDAELNEENNRYNITVSYEADCLEKYHNDLYARYVIGIIIKGNPGVKVDTYSDGIYSYLVSRGVEGFVTGQSDGSISNIACGQNVVVVGSSNSRNTTPRVDGTIKNYNFTVGGVSNYSGYGTLVDGRVLPHFCAPGNMIVSSVSTPFIESQSDDYKNSMAAKVSVDGKDYYWMSECGTSMSSPFAAGVFALWLQADASLTVNDVREIASLTASKSNVDVSDPRWGAGNIDALAGLKEVLKRASINSVEHDETDVVSYLNNDLIQFSSIGAETIGINLYTADGRLVMNRHESNDSLIIDVSMLNSGVYLAEIITNTGRRVHRIVVR